jgi:hypothetical protein
MHPLKILVSHRGYLLILLTYNSNVKLQCEKYLQYVFQLLYLLNRPLSVVPWSSESFSNEYLNYLPSYNHIEKFTVSGKERLYLKSSVQGKVSPQTDIRTHSTSTTGKQKQIYLCRMITVRKVEY